MNNSHISPAGRRTGKAGERRLSAPSSSLIVLVCASLTVGCRGEAERMGPPPPELARASLAKALEAWKGGRAGGPLIGSSPGVGVVDTLRQERPLLDYEILGPLYPLAEARPFGVRLTLDSPREVVTARYIVLGVDPIWVFRDEDYQLILHWEHKMTEGEGGGTPPPAGPHVGPEAH